MTAPDRDAIQEALESAFLPGANHFHGANGERIALPRRLSGDDAEALTPVVARLMEQYAAERLNAAADAIERGAGSDPDEAARIVRDMAGETP